MKMAVMTVKAIIKYIFTNSTQRLMFIQYLLNIHHNIRNIWMMLKKRDAD